MKIIITYSIVLLALSIEIYGSENKTKLSDDAIQIYKEIDKKNDISLKFWKAQHKYYNIKDRPSQKSKRCDFYKPSEYFSQHHEKFCIIDDGDHFLNNMPNKHADSPDYVENEQDLNYIESADIIVKQSKYCLINIDLLIQIKKNKHKRILDLLDIEPNKKS